MADAQEIARLNAREADLERSTSVLLGATTGTRRGPAARAAALSGYLNAIDGNGPSSYDDLVKQQAADDAKAQREAEAAARQAAAESERQQRIQDKADEREWRANQAALERKSREQMKLDEIKARPAPRDPVAEKIEYDRHQREMDKVDTQIKAEKAYESTKATLEEMRALIDAHGDSLFGADTWIGEARDAVGKNVGTDTAAAREKFDLLEAKLIESAVEARKGTGSISDKDLAVIERGGVGRKVSSAKAARDNLDTLEMFSSLKANKKAAPVQSTGTAPAGAITFEGR